MAMPVAMGIEGMTSKNDKATIASDSPPRVGPCVKTNIQTSVRAAAEVNHLICWRSSPPAQRKRTNSEITAPRPARNIIIWSARLTSPSITAERHPSNSGKPPGRTSAGPRSGQRTMEVRTQISPIERAPSQPRCPDPGRQPGQLCSQRESARIREERIDRVLLSSDQETIEEGDSAEYPTYGITGTVRDDQGPDHGERHRYDGEVGY